MPGVNETYRVNGHAQISQDADIKRRFAVNGKEPATVMVVTVEETFPHCAKALVRSDLWKAGSRGRPQGVPTMGDFVAARYPGTDSAAFNNVQRRYPARALLSEHSFCQQRYPAARLDGKMPLRSWSRARCHSRLPLPQRA